MEPNRQFSGSCELKIWRITLEKIIRTFFDVTSSFLHHCVAIIKLKLEFQSVRKLSIRVKLVVFICPCDLDIWQMTLPNKRALLLCHFKFCNHFVAICDSNGATDQKQSNRVDYWCLWKINSDQWTDICDIVVTVICRLMHNRLKSIHCKLYGIYDCSYTELYGNDVKLSLTLIQQNPSWFSNAWLFKYIALWWNLVSWLVVNIGRVNNV